MKQNKLIQLTSFIKTKIFKRQLLIIKKVIIFEFINL